MIVPEIGSVFSSENTGYIRYNNVQNAVIIRNAMMNDVIMPFMFLIFLRFFFFFLNCFF